jgi:hypothetical protein
VDNSAQTPTCPHSHSPYYYDPGAYPSATGSISYNCKCPTFPTVSYSSIARKWHHRGPQCSRSLIEEGDIEILAADPLSVERLGRVDCPWEAQQGLGPICSQKITRKTKWHNRQFIWRSKGGPFKVYVPVWLTIGDSLQSRFLKDSNSLK